MNEATPPRPPGLIAAAFAVLAITVNVTFLRGLLPLVAQVFPNTPHGALLQLAVTASAVICGAGVLFGVKTLWAAL